MKRMSQVWGFVVLVGVMGLCSGVVQAEITVTSTDSSLGNQTFTTAELASFDPSGADKIVVMSNSENNGGASAVTYNGDALSKLASNNNSWGMSEIWMLDATDATGGAFSAGDLIFTGGDFEVGISIIAIAGSEDGVSAATNVSARTINFSPGAANAIVAATFYNNGEGGVSPSAPSGFTTLLNITSSTGGYSASGAYWLNQPATATSYTFNGTSRASLAIAAFAPAPPPAGAVIVVR